MLVAIIFYLLHAVLFGYAARRVTEYRSQPDGFWWGFWLGGLGLLVVIFRSNEQTEIRTAPPGSSIRRSWRCVQCGARNPVGKENCQSCGASRNAPDPVKNCPFCSAKNKAVNTTCFVCGRAFEN